MTSSSAAGRPDSAAPWQWPVDLARYDAAPLLRPAEQDAIIELGPATCAAWPGTMPSPGPGSRSGACCGRSTTPPLRWRAR